MKLSDCPVRVPIRLTEVPVPGKNQLRMQEMGVRVGTQTFVVQRGAYGGRILNIAGARVAIDNRSARLIQAEVVA
ncbi:MAG: ferrous iron transport protein A [Actinomycetaceae bacterium]|nr:ferrous iron transport protein A [Actinomycetaceae bacterium]MDY5854148.1 ferrous iron transport protein A [Arcanobacterium sp.]